jgi:hypothetical protein
MAITVVFVLILSFGFVLVGWRWMMLRLDAGIPQAALASFWTRVCPPRRRSWLDLERRTLDKMRSGVVVTVTGRAVVPAQYDIYVSTEDLERLGTARPFFESDLHAAIHSEAMQRGWHLVEEGVQVEVREDPCGMVGVPRVIASFRPEVGAEASPPRLTHLETTPLITEMETNVALTEMDDRRVDAWGRPSWRLVPLDEADPEVALSDRIGALTIGRGHGSDLRLAHPTVSGLHARLHRTLRGWQIEDAGSRNGTYVDDLAVDSPVDLVEGMVLAFSRSGPRYTLSASGGTKPAN